MRASYALVLVPALVGTVLGLIAYAGPFGLTGVEGTPGALLALAGAAGVALGALLAMSPRLGDRLRGLLNMLLGLGAALTAVAAWFLMQPAFAAAMAVAFAGLLVALALPGRRRIA